MGTETKPSVKSLRNNGAKILPGCLRCIWSKDGLSAGTAMLWNSSMPVPWGTPCTRVRGVVGGCNVTWPTQEYRGRKRQPCTLQQVSVAMHFYMSTAKPQKYKYSHLGNVYGSDSEWEVLESNKRRGEGHLTGSSRLRPFLVYHSRGNRAGTASSLFLQVSSATGLYNTLIWSRWVLAAVRWQRRAKIILSSFSFNLLTVLMVWRTAWMARDLAQGSLTLAYTSTRLCPT